VVKALDDSIKTSTDPFTWYMWQFTEAKFAPISFTSTPTACPTYYYVTDTDYDRTVISGSIVYIDKTDPALYKI
jgi:hypothetical protein